ncbi:DUF1780 domain-containing protein [Pseudomonas aeruginosa]
MNEVDYLRLLAPSGRTSQRLLSNARKWTASAGSASASSRPPTCSYRQEDFAAWGTAAGRPSLAGCPGFGCSSSDEGRRLNEEWGARD